MKTINYLKGDATKPNAEGNKIIAHICNDVGGWGKGFVLALTKRWKQPESEYRQWAKSKENFVLGATQLVQCEASLFVANMIAQHKLGVGLNGEPPIRYDAVRSCLIKLKQEALNHSASIHMPRIGCGLAGGEWSEIEAIIMDELCRHEIEVTVYDF